MAQLLKQGRAGIGRLVAEVVAGATRLTELSHASPARLFSVQHALAEQAGAACFAVGGYGGGLLGGDQVHLDIHIGRGATAVGRTQGTTKVYKAKHDGAAAVQSVHAVVKSGGLLVLAPDPVMPFAQARQLCSWVRAAADL